jgi:hypothetical protein
MSVKINFKKKVCLKNTNISDEQIIDIIFEIIKDTNPRRCVKTKKNSVLVRNYFIFKEHERWYKQVAIMHSFHPWQLIQEAKIALVDDETSRNKYINYQIDIGLIVTFITGAAFIFGIFSGIAFGKGNSSVVSGITSGLITSFVVSVFFSLGVLMSIQVHKTTLTRIVNSINNI